MLAQDAGLKEPPPLQPFCADALRLELADVNGDGNLDAVAISLEMDRPGIIVAEGDGLGGLASCALHAGGVLPFGLHNMAFGDFNQDGRLDVVLADLGSGRGDIVLGNGPRTGRLLALLSDANAYHQSEVLVDSAPFSFSVFASAPLAAGDLDGDDFLDLVLAIPRKLIVLRGDGGGSFSYLGDLEGTTKGPERLELADFNGDGYLDLVFQFQDVITLYLGDGLASPVSGWRPSWNTAFSTDGFAAELTAGDFSGDGLPDLVVVSQGRLDGEYAALLYPSLGGGALATTPLRLPVPFGMFALIADFDADGTGDLLLQGHAAFQVYRSSDEPRFAKALSFFYHDGLLAGGPARAGDMNGDGDLDLVAPIYLGEPAVAVLAGNGDGSFAAVAWEPEECGQSGPAILADLDEDGIDDLIAFRDLSTSDRASLGPCAFKGLPGGRAPFFEPMASYPDVAAIGGRVADFDGDGHLDLVHGVGDSRSVPAGGIRTWLGTGNGTLGESLFTEHPRNPQEYMIVSGIADFNKDGILDLLASGLFVFLGNGDGSFRAGWSTLDSPPFARECCRGATVYLDGSAIEDVDGDGHADVAVADSLEANSKIWLLHGLGDGTFEPSVLVPPSVEIGRTLEVVLHDFSQDGRLDLLTRVSLTKPSPSGNHPYYLMLHRASREGGFEDPIATEIPKLKYSPGGLKTLQVHDLNLDGHDDIAMVVQAETLDRINLNDLKVLYGYEDGQFTEPILVELERPSLWDVNIRDLNGDGLPDFIVAGGGRATPGVEVILQEDVFRLGPRFRRGDASGDGTVNLTDPVLLLNSLFLGRESPGCREAADADDDGVLNLTDAIAVLNFLFLGGANPPPPGPHDCGPDRTPDALGCERSPCE
jgi:hypothetical protein